MTVLNTLKLPTDLMLKKGALVKAKLLSSVGFLSTRLMLIKGALVKAKLLSPMAKIVS